MTRSSLLLVSAALLLVCLSSIAVDARRRDSHVVSLADAELQFERFIDEWGKEYSSAAEKARRFELFRDNLDRAVRDNADAGGAEVFGVTQFSDLSPDEFRARFLNAKPRPDSFHAFHDGRVGLTPANHGRRVAALPTQVDWREAGIVTRVNDQGSCGSCWAFSAVETIESAFLRSNPAYLDEAANGWGLSVQQIIDCNNFAVFGGCNGGWADLAYEYVKKNGIMNATASPYQGQTMMCLPLAPPVTYVANMSFATPPCLFNCSSQDMAALQATVAMSGPVSVCLDANGWSSYKGGIYPASKCNDQFMNMNHCVQLVGYNVNTTDASQSYWIVRNSWGPKWGLNGYIHLQLDYGLNTCGVATQATTVELASHAPNSKPKKLLAEI